LDTRISINIYLNIGIFKERKCKQHHFKDINDTMVSKEIVLYLWKWLLNHVMAADKKYAINIIGGINMATILELASDIVSSHASTTRMSSDELVLEIQKVHAALWKLEASESIVIEVEEPRKPAITLKVAFKKNEIICMVCGKGKMKTLTRHLSMVHNMKPGEYRKQYGVPSKQSLTAKSFSEARRKSAIDRGLGGVLAKARETKLDKIKGKNITPAKVAKSKTAKNAAPDKPVKGKAAKETKIPF
jgi:predicted transcriptional regulator